MAGLICIGAAAWLVLRQDGDRRAFTVLVAACVLASPIVWPNYAALLFVPIAVTWPRLAPAWFFGYVVWLVGVLLPKPAAADVCCRPADVPELDKQRSESTPQTIRELLEQHRRDPNCATCHDQIDPIGFGLENYDLLGRWRTEEAGKPIDTEGELPDGAKFNGPAELKRVLLERKDEFIRHLTTKMLGYALGRGLTVTDRCSVEEIVRKVKEGEYRSHELVVGIVSSVPFRYRASDGLTAPSGPVDASVKQESSP